MTTLISIDPKLIFNQQLETLREYARCVFQLGQALAPWEEEDSIETLQELWALGRSFKLTEREMVELVYEGLFAVELGCDCPTCQGRKSVTIDSSETLGF